MSSTVPVELKLVPRRPDRGGTGSINAFSVDVEEWFQVGAFENTLSRDEWPNLESRVEQQTNDILELLASAGVTSTFFCLGWVAERNPQLIKRIADAGHEIGCHGMDHRRIFTMSFEEFLQDIIRAKALLEDASGLPVIGYRAPSFSMTSKIWPYYEAIENAGFKYSSSVVPAKTDHYGMAGLPRLPFFPIEGSRFIEVPMTVVKIAGKTIPASGGGYFRLLPKFLSYFLMKKANAQTDFGTIFYMHPWEVDPGQPFIRNAPMISRFRHYTGQSQMAKKIFHMLATGQFTRMDKMLSAQLSVDL